MLDFAAMFLRQAEASPYLHFLYEVATHRVVFVNAAYELLLRSPRARVNEDLPALLDRLPPEDLPLWQRYWKMWQRGTLQDEVELRLLGQGLLPEQWFSLLPFRYQDAAGQVWLSGSLREITADKQYQLTNEKFSAKKNTVLELLSHDLAGAFVVLQQLTTHLQQELGEPANPNVPQLLGLMQQTSQQSVALIHDLVDQEFMESASIPLKLERVELGEKVRQCLEPYYRMPGAAARMLRYDVPGEPVYAHVDPNKLLQVVNNLVANAFKFTPDEKRIRVTVEAQVGSVRLRVADEGIGIPAALLPHVFERYTPARRPGLRGEPTTGLGLSLCQTIVTLHHGSLSVTSTEGEGSTFTVDLPQTLKATRLGS